MADQVLDPIAQGQAPAEQGDNQQAPEVAEQTQDQKFQVGIQKRIDELTARFHQEREASSKKDEHILTLTQQLVAASQRQNERPPEPAIEVPEGMDPAQAAYFDRMFSKIQSQFQQQLTQVAVVTQSGEAAQAAVALTAKFGITDPSKVSWVQERAKALAAGWKQNGLPFAPADAARFATMEFLEQGGLQQPTKGAGQFMPITPTGGGSNPVPNLAPQASRSALPNNFNSLRPEDQLSILQRRGVDDIPL